MQTSDPSTVIALENKSINPAEVTENNSSQFRALKWNERVLRGDFIKDAKRGFEPWTGLTGFQANSFVEKIYRKSTAKTGATKTTE